MVTTGAFHHRSVDACEQSVDDTRVWFEILLVDILHGPVSFIIGNISIEFLQIYWSFLILKRANQVHEELVAIMLHGGIKLFTNQVLKTRRIEYSFIFSITLKYFPEKFAHFPTIVIWIWNCFIIMESFELHVQIIISEFCDRQQALQTSIHVAVQWIILKAYNTFPEFLVMMVPKLFHFAGLNRLLSWLFIIINVHLFNMVVILVNYHVLRSFRHQARDFSFAGSVLLLLLLLKRWLFKFKVLLEVLSRNQSWEILIGVQKEHQVPSIQINYLI